MSEAADEERWRIWCPAEAGNADVAQAVEKFEPLRHPAARAATAWLKEEALATHPFTLTYLYMLDRRVEGFFAICSASVELRQSHRKQLAPEVSLPPTQGASLIAWLAKHRDTAMPGEKIVDFAFSIAAKVAEQQGTTALVLDPFDDATASMWLARYEFRESATKIREDQRRLWMPLHSN